MGLRPAPMPARHKRNQSINRLFIMIDLILASFIWAFSFGLSAKLSGIGPHLSACLRMLIACLIFLPFMRRGPFSLSQVFRLMSIGAIQFGLTYILYFHSFQYLESHQVALFAMMTPVYVALIANIQEGRFNFGYLVAAGLSVAGAMFIRYQSVDLNGCLTGFFLVEASNLCFAYGQMAYKSFMMRHPQVKDKEVCGFLFLGALILSAFTVQFTNGWSGLAQIDLERVFILLYLGVIASGLAFYLWNRGSVKTRPGMLAVMNNLKVPLAISVSILIFGESTDIRRLLVGAAIMVSALLVSHYASTKPRLRPIH